MSGHALSHIHMGWFMIVGRLENNGQELRTYYIREVIPEINLRRDIKL